MNKVRMSYFTAVSIRRRHGGLGSSARQRCCWHGQKGKRPREGELGGGGDRRPGWKTEDGGGFVSDLTGFFDWARVSARRTATVLHC